LFGLLKFIKSWNFDRKFIKKFISQHHHHRQDPNFSCMTSHRTHRIKLVLLHFYQFIWIPFLDQPLDQPTSLQYFWQRWIHVRQFCRHHLSQFSWRLGSIQIFVSMLPKRFWIPSFRCNQHHTWTFLEEHPLRIRMLSWLLA